MRWTPILALVIACTGTADDGRDTSAARPSAAPPLDSSRRATANADTASDSLFTVLAAAFDKGVGTETQPPPPPPLTLPAQQPLTFEPSGRPKLPYVVRDMCMIMECNTRFRAVACRAAPLRVSPSDTAAIVTTIRPLDTVRVWQTDLRVTAPGIVVMSRDSVLDMNSGDGDIPPSARADTVRLSRGDTIYVLHDIASQERIWAHRGKVHRSEPLWSDHENQIPESFRPKRQAGTPTPNPTVEDWWWVQPRRGAPGWWHAENGDPALQHPDETIDICAIVNRRAADTGAEGKRPR